VRIFPGYLTITSSIIESILSAAENLEELYFEISCSVEVKYSLDAIDVVKSKGKNLKKFTVKGIDDFAGAVREKMKIFDDTAVQTVFAVCSSIDSRYIPSWRKFNSTCTWRK
jgi:hypothetical protein